MLSNSAQSGLTGGAIATMGVIFVALIRKQEVKDRLRCMYCDGTGQIACGACLTTGYRQTTSPSGEVTKVMCSVCEGRNTVMCINCQGSGKTVPDEIFQRLGDEEQGFSEDDYLGLAELQQQAKENLEAKEAAAVLKETVPTAEDKEVPQAKDSSQ
jgi:DnaJ-class molecular chaperone